MCLYGMCTHAVELIHTWPQVAQQFMNLEDINIFRKTCSTKIMLAYKSNRMKFCIKCVCDVCE